jgi:hypothetical protein
MTPLDLAWSVLKSNPNFQAFEAGGYHPESHMPSPSIRNLGTVDPAIMAMGLRQVAGGNPQERVSRLMAGDSDPMRTFSLPLQAQGPDPYESYGMGDDFEGLGEGSRDYFGVSRQPRPVAGTQPPPLRSPQRIIDSFMGDDGISDVSPLTPEDEVELARRLRMAQQ